MGLRPLALIEVENEHGTRFVSSAVNYASQMWLRVRVREAGQRWLVRLVLLNGSDLIVGTWRDVGGPIPLVNGDGLLFDWRAR